MYDNCNRLFMFDLCYGDNVYYCEEFMENIRLMSCVLFIGFVIVYGAAASNFMDEQVQGGDEQFSMPVKKISVKNMTEKQTISYLFLED